MKFLHVCDIELDRNKLGEIILESPQSRYKNLRGERLNAYGAGPFCRFRIDKRLKVEGVYLLRIGEQVHYIGECDDLAKRFNSGYGLISPKNCYVTGQSTNCKINQLVLKEVHAGRPVQLWFKIHIGRTERKQLEFEISHLLRPLWNGQVTLAGERKATLHPQSGSPDDSLLRRSHPEIGTRIQAVNQRMNYEDLLRVARRLAGQELQTVGGRATFTIEVRQERDEEAIYCTPTSSQMPRRLGSDTLRALDYFNQTGSMRLRLANSECELHLGLDCQSVSLLQEYRPRNRS